MSNISLPIINAKDGNMFKEEHISTINNNFTVIENALNTLPSEALAEASNMINNLNVSIGVATNTQNELNQFVKEHSDIVDLDTRVTSNSDKIGDLTGNGITEENLSLAIKNDRASLSEIEQKLTLVKLTTGDNLNTILNTQVEYYAENDGIVSGILNIPSGVTDGFHIKFIKTNTNTLYGKQLLISRTEGTYERVYENGVLGSWVKVPTKSDIDALIDKTTPVLLASGVFSTGNTITLSQAITNFARIVFSYGDGGSETLMHLGFSYPSNIAVAEIFKGVTTFGNYEIAITNATTITVTSAGTKYIRKIYGFKF